MNTIVRSLRKCLGTLVSIVIGCSIAVFILSPILERTRSRYEVRIVNISTLTRDPLPQQMEPQAEKKETTINTLTSAPSQTQNEMEKEKKETRKWPRIFCMINTIPKNHYTRVPSVNETWAKHCDEYVFTTTQNENNESPFWVFDFGNSTYAHDDHLWLWDRIRAMFRKVKEEKLNDFDWFLKADDDSFFVIENLKEFLVNYDPNSPYFIGSIHRLENKPPEFDYMSGGSGYIMSREGVNRFVSVMTNSSLCRTTTYTHEDTEVGYCLRNGGAKFINPLDNEGRGQMIPINLVNVVHDTRTRRKDRRDWVLRSSKPTMRMGKECCSDKLISTHFLDPMEMKMYYYLVYSVKVAAPPN